MEKLNTQILNLVEQKLDLAQQLEMWEVHTTMTQHNSNNMYCLGRRGVFGWRPRFPTADR